MSLMGRVLRFVFMPAVRVTEQFRQSGRRLSEMRQAHLAPSRGSQPDSAHPGSTQDEDGPASPAQRFERLYAQRGWTEKALAQQLVAVRRTKRAALAGCLLGTVAAMVLVLLAPLWALVLLVPAAAGLTSFGLAMALKFALFQAQIEQRELIGLRHYLGRRDMIAHLLGLRSRVAR